MQLYSMSIALYRRRSSDVRRMQRMARLHQGASDRRRINSVIDRARRLGYCSPDTPTFDELCDIADDKLFSKAVRLSDHALHALLPPSSTASQRYNLRHRAHSLQLPEHINDITDLSDSNFMTRMLYKNIYIGLVHWCTLLSCLPFLLIVFLFELSACILSCRNKRILIGVIWSN